MLSARAAGGCDIKLSAREDYNSQVPAIEVNSCVGIDVLRADCDAPACPLFGNRNFPLVPGGGEAAQTSVLPALMVVDCLAVLLHIIGDSRPTPRDLEVSPLLGGHDGRVFVGRLPAPQTVDAYLLASRR